MYIANLSQYTSSGYWGKTWYRVEVTIKFVVVKRLTVNGGSGTDINISKRNAPDKDALIKLAKEAKVGGKK